jgi:hypothetical protein
MKYLILLVLFVLSGCGTPLSRCKAAYEPVRNDPWLNNELAKQGTTFDRRVDEACKNFIKDGQKF